MSDQVELTKNVSNSKDKAKNSQIEISTPKKVVTIIKQNQKDNHDQIRNNYEGEDLSKIRINNLMKAFSLSDINQDNPESVNYFKYVWYILLCKIKSLKTYSQLDLAEKKINISTMIKALNYFTSIITFTKSQKRMID